MNIKELDEWLFLKINNQYTNSFFDLFLPFMRTPEVWIPVYIFLISFALLNFKKQGWIWVLCFFAVVAICDSTGNYGFKHIVQRIRPCRDPEFMYRVRFLLDNCSGGFSFVSNHAANHFGMGAFIFFTFRNINTKIAFLALMWAAIISYAQIYVGVHYPMDVIGGAILGVVVGKLIANFFNKHFSFTNLASE